MTHSEYKELVKEYRETDSISKRDEIRSKVRTEAIALCETLDTLYNKYGKDFVDDSDYQIGKGGYSLNDFSFESANLTYSDHWQYGGSCSIGIMVPMRYLDAETRTKLEDALRESHVEKLKRCYTSNLGEIENIKKNNLKILEKLKELGADTEGLACNP